MRFCNCFPVSLSPPWMAVHSKITKYSTVEKEQRATYRNSTQNIKMGGENYSDFFKRLTTLGLKHSGHVNYLVACRGSYPWFWNPHDFARLLELLSASTTVFSLLGATYPHLNLTVEEEQTANITEKKQIICSLHDYIYAQRCWATQDIPLLAAKTKYNSSQYGWC